MIKKFCWIIALLIGLSFSLSAQTVQQPQSPLPINTVVLNSCRITHIDSIDFGDQGPSTVVTIVSGSIVLFCTKGASIFIFISQGGQSLQDSGSNQQIQYALYKDANATEQLNNQVGWNQTSTSAFTSLKVIYYAKLFGGQDVLPGHYMDTVVLTVDF